MRINKFLAEKGVASRRRIDEMIGAGRICINGKIATLGEDVSEKDEITVDGQPVAKDEVVYSYYLMNKPKGVLCTVSDDRGRKTVMDLLPENAGQIQQRADHRSAPDLSGRRGGGPGKGHRWRPCAFPPEACPAAAGGN